MTARPSYRLAADRRGLAELNVSRIVFCQAPAFLGGGPAVTCCDSPERARQQLWPRASLRRPSSGPQRGEALATFR
jgi:hypothetical protein